MADIQHRDARKLLHFLAEAVAKNQIVTYREAAALLGRQPPEKYGRAVAQICDLLDAAAFLAGVPLLALVWVREQSTNVNSKPWKDDQELRKAILNRSRNHHFIPQDFEAILHGLDKLGNLGNRAAWKHAESGLSRWQVYCRLVGDNSKNGESAIDDLGTDLPSRVTALSSAYLRDPTVREAVLERAQGRCEFCLQHGFLKADGTPYLESHHVIALANEGADRVTNVIAVCPNDHREAHFGARREEMEMKMILKLRELGTPVG